MLESSTIHIVPYNYPETFEVKTTENSGDIDIKLPRALGSYKRTEEMCHGAPVYEHVDGQLFLRRIEWQSDKYLTKWGIMEKYNCHDTSTLVLQGGTNLLLPSIPNIQWTYRTSVIHGVWSDGTNLNIQSGDQASTFLDDKKSESDLAIIIGCSTAGAVMILGTLFVVIWKCCCKQNSKESRVRSVAEVDQNPDYGSDYYYEETEIKDDNTYYEM